MLEDVSLFAGLDEEAVRNFEAIALRKRFPKNTIIFSKGDQSDSLYIVQTGRVKAVIHDEQGKEIVLSVFGPGEYFGEMAALDGVPRSATIVTKETTEMLTIHKNDFRQILTSNPDMIFNLLQVLLERLRRANQKIEGLAFTNVYGRVANLLMQFAEPAGDGWIVKEKLTHQEIANMIGSSREMVSRIMVELVDGGYLAIDKKRISILKKLA
jgi:CRP/FNR family cyclic AMP-dependent transcriptional regulator